MTPAHIINNIFYFFYLLIIVRIFLTWIPSIDWSQQPIKAVRTITDLYLEPFRRIVPPVGGLDLSPIVALIVLQILQGLIVGAISQIR